MKSRAEVEAYAKERAKTDPLWRETEKILERIQRMSPKDREAALEENLRDMTGEERTRLLELLEKHPFVLGG